MPSSSTTDDFEFLEILGQGSYGVVHKVKRKNDNKVYAMKQINIQGMKKNEREATLKEVQILASLDHPCVIRYFDSFISKSDKKLNIVMEYAAKGTLFEVIDKRNDKKLPEKQIWTYFLQALYGLNYIHSRRILHRDIKPMNMFIDENDVIKIGDFGVSRVLSHTNSLAESFVGTPYYLSPELCNDKPYGEKSDVWALGCILYELCTLKRPFEAGNQAALILKILKAQYSPISTMYSMELSKVINLCLSKSPSDRPTTNQLLSSKLIIDKGKEFNIYNIIYNLPIPVQKQQSLRGSDKENTKVSNETGNAQQAKEPIPHVDNSQSKIVLRSGSSRQKGNGVSARPSMPWKRSNPPPRPSSRLQQDIEAVRNLPRDLVKVSSEPILSVRPSAMPLGPVEPDTDVSTEGNVEISIPDDAFLETPVQVDSDEEFEDADEDVQEDGLDGFGVTWKVVQVPNAEKLTEVKEISVKQSANISVNIETDSYSLPKDQSVVATPQGVDKSLETIPGFKHEKSKARYIDRLLIKKENKEKQIEHLREYCLTMEIPRHRLDELIQFFLNLEENAANEEKIHQYVFGRISFAQAEILDHVREIKRITKQIAKIDKEVTRLLNESAV